MTDVLIREVPDEVVAAIDVKARHLGLSRAEYLRRVLHRESRADSTRTGVEALEHLCALISDLADPEVRRAAWS